MTPRIVSHHAVEVPVRLAQRTIGTANDAKHADADTAKDDGQPTRMVRVEVRSARREDASEIRRILDIWAPTGQILSRDEDDIADTIAGFVVATVDGTIGACAALLVWNTDLAEVRSVAADPAMHGCGLGRHVMAFLLEEAQRLGVRRLFLLTKTPVFFEKNGFHSIDPDILPDSFLRDFVRVHRRSYTGKQVMMRAIPR